MNIALTSYATARFAQVRAELEESAQQFGIPRAFSFVESDLLASDYYRENEEILTSVCGAGYWAWKPYFILEALANLSDGDVVLYCDAGTRLIASATPLIDLALVQPSGLVLFDARPLKNRQFTKRDCFIRLECDTPAYWNANKLIATVIVVRKCPASIGFLREWLHHCRDRAAITDDPNVCGRHDLRGYLQHRHDQAILSLLAAKHRIETFRNPSYWGNFLKMPAHRVQGEPTPSPFNLVPEMKGYAPTPQNNSPYGTIFEVNRQPNWVGKKGIKLLQIESRWARLLRLIDKIRFR